LKICSDCGEEKELEMFSKRKISKNGYRNQCRTCCNLQRKVNTTDSQRNITNARKRERYKTDDEYRIKDSIRKKNFYENNKEHFQKYNKQYWIDNEEKLKAINIVRSRKHYKDNKKRYKKNHQVWRENNKDKTNGYTAKRRAIKLNAMPLWANKEKIVEIYKEARKITRITGIKYEVDHIIPLQNKNVCGLHTEENLQIITRSQNRKKSNKIKGELLTWQAPF